MADRVRILVFAKAPEPGAVKTRLAPVLGSGGAAVLAARLARRTLHTARDAAVGPIALVCAPDVSHDFFELCRRRHGLSLIPQGDGDLGARMHRAFAGALAEAGAAILVGTDIPDLRASDFRDTVHALQSGIDVVLGPAEDGGYWLIGLRRPEPRLFDDIPWSTPEVLGVTRERAATLGLGLRELPVRGDIDRPDDLHALLARDDLAPLAADLVLRHRAGHAP